MLRFSKATLCSTLVSLRRSPSLTQCYKEAQILPIDERNKLDIMVAIGEANFRIVEGANERIQLEAMLAQIALGATKRR